VAVDLVLVCQVIHVTEQEVGLGFDGHDRPTIDNGHGVLRPREEEVAGLRGDPPTVITSSALASSLSSYESTKEGNPHIFKKNGTLMTSPISMPQRRHESSRVHLQQFIRLLIRINLDVLIRNTLDFKSDPDSLHEWTLKD
jgi:hypothetical protein